MIDCKDGNVKKLNIAYIGGGSRGWAWRLMKDLALEERISGTVKLYDIDSQAAGDNEAIGNGLSLRTGIKSAWRYEAVETLKEALAGADFVIISILPGTFKEMHSDMHEPERYGIYQSVGDTTGPGGLVRALRTIPMFVEIGESISRYAPDAWVINYTNPMALCIRTLYTVFPSIKAFGCCHEVFGTQCLLAAVMEDMGIAARIGREDIKVNVLGLNHFTWFDSATYQSVDLFPYYREFVDKYYDTGYKNRSGGDWRNNPLGSVHRVQFDLFRRYGLIAAANDRHLAEFVPAWYLKDIETIRSWKFNLTSVAWRIEDMEKRKETSGKLLAGKEEIEMDHSGEEGVRQICALLGLEEFVTNVNLPNWGQIRNLPDEVVVESNAVFNGNGIKPVFAGALPESINALVSRVVYNYETILKAALSKDKQLAFSAFVNDPLVNIGFREAADLFDKMLKNTGEYLPGWRI
ncbi:MAG: alpha-glucosidase/alpha-galactosidase [bacterium]|nr:alpha-glucosidase/alpha-galactosidase [bacterium]